MHDDQVVVDSSVIMEYLDEIFPEPSLAPPDPVERAHMRAWLRYIEEVPTVAVRFSSFNQFLLRSYGYRQISAEQFARVAAARPLRKDFYLKMGQSGFSEEEIAQSMERLAATVERINTALAVAGPCWSARS